MVITLDEDLGSRVSSAAKRRGQDVPGYIRAALLKQLQTEMPLSQTEAERKEEIDRQFQEAANDPLFLQDNLEVSRDFESIDAETARMIAE